MSSVTEASRWPQAGSAVRREPRFALRGSARLQLVRADAAGLVFAGRQAPLAPLFLCPLLLALGSLPWVAPRPLDATRATTSLVFVAAACGVAAWARPRRRQLVVAARDPASNQAATREAAARNASAPDAVVVSPGKLRWVLGAEQAPNALSADYTVTLEPLEGGSYTVLQSPDPERLLQQFAEVLRHWPGSVDCRWGLPDGARPWNVEPHSGPRALARGADRRVIASPIAHRPLVWCTWLMAAFVIGDLAFLITSASAGLAHVHPLSLVLPLLLGSFLSVLAVGLATGQDRLVISGGVYRERSGLGLRRAGAAVRRETVRGVYALGGPSAERWHVLVDSADGPLALPAPRQTAEALALEAERAIRAARST